MLKIPKRMVNGWDSRDYKLWCELFKLPSFGLLPSGGDEKDVMISRRAVVDLMQQQAEERVKQCNTVTPEPCGTLRNPHRFVNGVCNCGAKLQSLVGLAEQGRR